jgi:GT2 family glycosyltransferase
MNIYKDESNLSRIQHISFAVEEYSWPSKVTEGLTIIVLNKDKPELISQVLTGFRKVFSSTNKKIELLIGDTGSANPETKKIYSHLEQMESVYYLAEYHFSRNNNKLVEFAKYDTVLFLNNDVLVDANPESIIKAWDYHISLGTGSIVSCVMNYPNGNIQHLGVDFLSYGENKNLPFHPLHNKSKVDLATLSGVLEAPAVTGAFLMISLQMFIKCGGFDVRYMSECQDVALCLDSRVYGGECYIINCGPLTHIENATRPKNEENWKDRRRFLRKYSAYIEALA